MDGKHTWQEPTVADRLIYDGRIIQVHELTVQLPGGGTSTREVVYHPGAVAVLAEPEPGRLLFVEQFRKAPGEMLLELPAGKLDPGEPPLACAKRELAEETGYRAAEWTPLCSFYTSPGFANECITLFAARDLQAGAAKPDEDEYVRVTTRSRTDVEKLLQQGQIRDAKTLVGVLWWLWAGAGRG
ncbi:MAG: NUDIX hydrolase [Alicyclobacillaceae bacterium]|nr:NUDIX hydrolase [Alicyclobacillaceae bacterium]